MLAKGHKNYGRMEKTKKNHTSADIFCKTLPIIYARANIFLGEKIA